MTFLNRGISACGLLFATLGALLAMSGSAGAADLNALRSLFRQNYQSLYTPRFCGLNIQRLVAKAQEEGINLDGAYVLRLEGGGFWETSGFYTRGARDQRAMLGYFHFVLVAEGYVFDFDLAIDEALPLENYIRLQFTPALEPYSLALDQQRMREDLPHWKISRIELPEILRGGSSATWKKKLGELVSIDEVFKLPRDGCTELLI